MNCAHYCPACYERVHPTKLHNIAGHFDTAHHPCICIGFPYRITLTAPKGR